MTFRSKLLASILTIVAATTAATLFIAQSQNTASYQSVLDELFRSEVNSFRARQEQQLVTTAGQAAKLAESVRLFAALEEGIPETYEIAGAELRVADRAFFRLADAKGKLIEPPDDDSFAGLAGSGVDEPLGNLITAGHAKPSAGTKAELGFVKLTPRDAAQLLASVAVSPITNFDTTVGYLIIGQRVDFRSTSESQGRAGLLTGVFVDGSLHSETISQTPAVAWETPLGLKKQTGAITIGGADYRIDSSILNPDSAFPSASLVSLYPLADLHRRQRDLLWRITAVGIAGLLVAAGVGSLLARRLSRPVRDLVSGTTEIKDGNYEFRVQKRTDDELGKLADAFNEMASGLALKEGYRSVLQLVNDCSAAERLMPVTAQPRGEAHEVSVMFCDVNAGNVILEKANAAKAAVILNAQMSALAQIARQYHGSVDKTEGNALIVLFETQQTSGQAAVSAVRCASEIMCECKRKNTGSSQPLRIGIASGSVNLAERLCSQTAPMAIVIDETTRAALPAGFETETLTALALEGFAEPVAAYRIKSVPP